MSVTRDCFMIDPEFAAFKATGLDIGSVCELGCKGFGKTKQAFESNGWRHVSIDLNGLGGALALDLTKEIDVSGIDGPFDVVTNFGTSEHVEGQRACWENIYELCRVDGFIVCCTPAPDRWPGHGKYYPSVGWYRQLAERNDMQLLWLTPVAGGKLNAATFKKLVNGAFVMPDDSEMFISPDGKCGVYGHERPHA